VGAAAVERDRWGTPRITAASLKDLWFAQGLVTAGERLFQLELFLRAATGTLSEIFGELTYDDDVFTRTIGLNRAGRRHATDTWSDLDHAMHASFRAGVRAWLKDRKGRTLSKDDIGHYQKIVVALSETIRIMGEIDEAIEEHGGWPGAFSVVEK